MVGWRVVRPVVAGALILFGVAAGARPVAVGGLTALGTVESGQWQLKEVGGNSRTVCLSDPQALLQIRHSGAQCSRFVIENTASVSTVHYTCPGQGHGRTTISVETPRLLSLETQGVAQGAPFDVQLEGRRIGTCSTAAMR